jgi:hypothetical protein
LSEIAVKKLKLLQGYSLRVELDAEGVSNLFVDEQKPIGESLGPNPARAD